MKAKIVYIALALVLAFSMSAVVVPASPAQAQKAQVYRFVNTDGICGGYSPCYTTIQAAVGAAGFGDIIVVAAGTYYEDVIVSVANLTLRGANEGKSAGADPEDRDPESIISGCIQIGSNDVVIDGFQIISIGSSGIYFKGGTRGLTISNNVVFGDGIGVLNNNRGIEFSDKTYTIVVSDNEFTNWKSGIYVNPSEDHNLEVTGNDFHDNFVGIGSEGLNNVSIQYNDFSRNTEGFGCTNVGTNVRAHYNNFYLSNADGINIYGIGVIDAEYNWWGDNSGPYHAVSNPGGLGVSVSDNVDYDPWTPWYVGETVQSGGCFIATAAYGTEAAAEIDVLRAFRDEVLLESAVGSQLVDWYYQTSPPVADFIAENDVLRTLVRELVVDPIASLVEVTGSLWRD